MNKAFFDSFEQRKSDFGGRAHLSDEIRAELVLSTGRTFVVQQIVEATDAWLHIDGHDVADDSVPLSIALPYHQINFVQFIKAKPKMRQAGFSR